MRDDFQNARRSYVVSGVVGVFICLVVLIFLSEISIYPEPYRVLWDVWALIDFVGPLFLAPLTYLAIAGEREGGRIKYVMGLPNSRLEYFIGKLLSRVSVAVTGIVLSVIAGFCIAALTYTKSPELDRFLIFTGVSILYVVTIVSIFIAISAATKRRSRAMFGTLAIYFLFVPFWFGFFPVINLETVMDALTTELGISMTEETRRRIGALSPSVAYMEATQPVYHGVEDQYEVYGQFVSDDKLVGRTWFNLLIMVGWSVVALVLGFLKFNSSELG